MSTLPVWRQGSSSTVNGPLPNVNVTVLQCPSSERATCPSPQSRLHFIVKDRFFLRFELLFSNSNRRSNVTNARWPIPVTPLFPSLYEPNARQVRRNLFLIGLCNVASFRIASILHNASIRKDFSVLWVHTLVGSVDLGSGVARNVGSLFCV